MNLGELKMVLINIFKYVLNLGPTVMLPIAITVIGLIFQQDFTKALKSGITIGIGF